MANTFNDIDKEKQKQILRLVTNSFYRELIKYGIDKSDLINISVNLLDYVTKKETVSNENSLYNKIFKLEDIRNEWQIKKEIGFNGISITPLIPEHITVVSSWLDSDEVKDTFITLFPHEQKSLEEYLLKKQDRQYFSIVDNNKIVGIIGADRINPAAKSVEMKKLIGALDSQGKGIGKKATFIFLYYIFNILDYNKVYIHSVDTNIKNINLNAKFGFELEGILYQEVYLNNKYRDVLRMGLLKQTWSMIFNSKL